MFDELLGNNHRTPAFQIVVKTPNKDKQDITTVVTERLISLSISDYRGFDADMLDLQLSDHDSLLALPSRDARISVAIGWKGQPLVDKGTYLVDEVQWNGSPDVLTIRARSADLKGSLSEKKERSFHDIKLGELVKQIAKENKLSALVGESLQNQTIEHIDQTSENDMNLLTRLAEQYDAIATVKNNTLLFMPTGKGKTASGKDLPVVEISKQSGDSYQFSITESENFKAVRAYWHNLDTGKKGEVVIDENSHITKKARMTKGRKRKDGTVTGQRLSKRKYNVLEQTEPVTSDSDQIKTVRYTFASEASAIRRAKAEFDKMKRGAAKFSLTMAYGDPELMPEMPAVLSGFKKEIDGNDWVMTQVTHDISDSGYTCKVEFELLLPEADVNVKKKAA